MSRKLKILILIGVVIVVVFALSVDYTCRKNLNTELCKVDIFGVTIWKNLEQIDYELVCENLTTFEITGCCENVWLSKNLSIPFGEDCNVGEWEVFKGSCYWVCNRTNNV